MALYLLEWLPLVASLLRGRNVNAVLVATLTQIHRLGCQRGGIQLHILFQRVWQHGGVPVHGKNAVVCMCHHHRRDRRDGAWATAAVFEPRVTQLVCDVFVLQQTGPAPAWQLYNENSQCYRLGNSPTNVKWELIGVFSTPCWASYADVARRLTKHRCCTQTSTT